MNTITTLDSSPVRPAPTRRLNLRRLATLLPVGALALAACGDDSSSSDVPAVADAPESDTLVTIAPTDLGDALVDVDGLTLYGFTNDVDAVPTCDDACAEAWPPLIVESTEVPAGLDPELYSVSERSDGSLQLVAGDWPLYLFAGDAAPGDITGQGVNDVWFAVAPDGSLITS